MKAAETHTTTSNNFAHQAKSTTPFFQKEGQERNGSMSNEQAPPFFQPKLTIGQPNDKYEKEADAVADAVVNQTTAQPVLQAKNISSIQRYMTNAEFDEQGTNTERIEEDKRIQEKPEVQRKEIFESKEEKSAGNVQRKCAACEQEEGAIQPKAVGGGEQTASSSLQSRLSSSKGGGGALPNDTRALMESSIGADFSNVRIHTDSSAVQMNKELGAQAFTHGKDVYFNSGKYDTYGKEGKRLLGHELTHVVQQNVATKNAIQRTIGDGHDLESPRFSGNEELEKAYDPGEKNLKKKDKGLAVRIVQQALLDAGQTLPAYGVDGKFGTETKNAVKRFQISQGLTGSDVDGILGEITMGLLDKYFLNHSHMAAIAIGQVPSTMPTPGVPWALGTAPSELMDGTRTLNDEDRDEIERRRTTEIIAPPGSVLPAFNLNIPTHSDNYEKRVEDRVNRYVTAYHREAKKHERLRADPANLHDMSFVESIALQSKNETDKVFGNYATGIPFVAGVNIFDAFEEKERRYRHGGSSYKISRANWRVKKIIQGRIRDIDRQHNASQSRSPEKEILKRIRARVVSARMAELTLIHKDWEAFAEPSTSRVFIQRYKGVNDAENRAFAWDTFQTMVHEYIHTLEHPASRTYRDSLPETRGRKTFREGMTEYFAHLVLSNTTYSPALRRAVEGAYHDPSIVHPIPAYSGYSERVHAESVVGVVGIRNAMAGFFLGQVELIGKTP